MPAIGGLKLFGSIAALIALAGLIWAAQDRFRLAEVVRGHNACAAAVGSHDGPLDPCDARIARAAGAARQAKACDAAVARDDLHAVRASCGAGVKRQGALLTAARADLDDAREQLATERAGRGAAIARAAERGRAEAIRKGKDDAVIRALPRGGDGRVRCDAECLRRLARD